jgi:NADPH:quinone reductase-like Zn-dependent oxidoreductase
VLAWSVVEDTRWSWSDQPARPLRPCARPCAPQAGTFVEAFATAHDALFTQARLRPASTSWCGGTGGVGIAAIQLGVLARARVTATNAIAEPA